jgi:hypothetical protein
MIFFTYRLALSLREVYPVGYERHATRDQLLYARPDHVRKGENAEHKEVQGQQQVDVVLAKDLENKIDFDNSIRR